MLYSDQYKTIFLHNPKCAGATITKWLTTHFPDFKWRLGINDKCHITGVIGRHSWHIPLEYAHYDVCTTIRHPYTRTISHFFHWKKINLFDESKSFDDFNKVYRMPRQMEYLRLSKKCVMFESFVEDPSSYCQWLFPFAPKEICDLIGNENKTHSKDLAVRHIYTDKSLNDINTIFKSDFENEKFPYKMANSIRELDDMRLF